MKKLKAVDLFAGGGGLSLGFKNAGITIEAAFDNWGPAVQLYRENFPDHPIHQVDLSTLEATTLISDYSPDMIIGGPPCQDFSSAGKRDESGGRANLTVTFSEIVAELGPEFFVMENVERSKTSKAFHDAKRIFYGADYGLTALVLDASLCGGGCPNSC